MTDSEVIYEVDYKVMNPVGFQLWRYMTDKEIRQIICYGGSSSGKSYSVAQIVLMLTIIEGENTLIMRKVGASIAKSIYEDFKVAAVQLGCYDMFTFSDSVKRIKSKGNGAKIDFAGLDDPEKIKGISNYKRVVMDELSEFELIDYKQIRKRLRGKEGQQIIGAFNPIKETHWIKRDLIDMETLHDVDMIVEIDGETIPAELCQVKSVRMNAPKSILNPRTREFEEHAPDTVVIQSTYLNNFWVVGSPDGTYGYYDEQCVADFEKDRLHDPDYYNVYALGEWGVIRTGSEYFASFNRGKHCGETAYNPNLPIHISVDNNVLPYISYSYWQFDLSEGIRAIQIAETCAGNPDNTAIKSATLVAQQLREMGYTGKIYLHGDCTTRNANTIDPQKRSFLDLVISSLTSEGVEVVDMVGKTNPNGQMSGEFINQIFEGSIEGLSIHIGEQCKTSIEDYMSVQKDVNGGILKTKIKNKLTGQTYEEHGHLSDTFRYVVCDVMSTEFINFSNKRKYNLYARDGFLHFYNPDTECVYSHELLYCMPNVGNKFVMVYGKKCGENWHICEVAFIDTTSTEDIKARLNAIASPMTMIECGKSYYPFVREMRAESEYEIRTVPESGDIDRRIAATSDYVRSSVLFNERKMAEDAEYADFMTSLLDYNKDSQSKEASAVLSGFVKMAVKLCTD